MKVSHFNCWITWHGHRRKIGPHILDSFLYFELVLFLHFCYMQRLNCKCSNWYLSTAKHLMMLLSLHFRRTSLSCEIKLIIDNTNKMISSRIAMRHFQRTLEHIVLLESLTSISYRGKSRNALNLPFLKLTMPHSSTISRLWQTHQLYLHGPISKLKVTQICISPNYGMPKAKSCNTN